MVPPPRVQHRGQWRFWFVGAGILALLVLGVLLLSPRRYVPLGPSGDTSSGDQMSYGVVERPGSGSRSRSGAAGTPPELDQYLRYIEQGQVRDRAGPDEQFVAFVADGIRRLAAAIDAVATHDTIVGTALRPQLQALRARANAVERTAARSTALEVREAFVLAVSLLERMYQARYRPSSAEIVSARQAAESLQGSQPLIRQQPEILRFFEQAGFLLRSMASAPT